MSKADEMFEKLGYVEKDIGKYEIQYKKIGMFSDKLIEFDLKAETILVGSDIGDCVHFSIQELQAINEKCKELRLDLKQLNKEVQELKEK